MSAMAEKKVSLAQVEFGSDFLRGSGSTQLDVSRFDKANPIAPGSYRVDLYVNQVWKGRQEVVFRTREGEASAEPCFNRAMLEIAGVDMDKLSEAVRAALVNAGPQACLRVEDLVQDATADFDGGELQLNVSIPQVSLRRSARGYVSPELWDKGINAALLNYNFNTYSTSTNSQTNTSYYLGLNSGLNLGDWHFRNNSSATWQSGGQTRIQTIASYAQTSIVPWRSQLTLGDAYTSGQLFDGMSYRGIQLGSDQRMLPDSQNGYAPIVRGIARTNARVQISQNGNVIYETTVAPGRFEITDLYPTGYGGNLHVVVTEADGSRNSFDIPYASVAQMLRPGTHRYNVTAGRTRSNGTAGIEANFVQGTYEHGIINDLTLFGGATVANDYVSLLGGSAFNTPIGAMSASITHSQAKVAAGDSRTGQSVKIDYNKLLPDSGTNFSVVAYRYSTDGYLRLADLLNLKAAAAQGFSSSQADRPRSQLNLSLSQTLGEGRGTFYVNGSTQNYWNRGGSGTQYQFGYSNTWRSISYNFSVQRQRDLQTGSTDTQYMFQMFMPLGKEVRSPSLSVGVNRDARGGNSLQTSLSGTAGADGNLSYGANFSRSPGNSTSSVNGEYRAPYAVLGGSYSYSGGSRQMSAQARGGVVAYAGGVVLSQDMGDTIGIVEARGAGGAEVNAVGVRLDRSGYAVVPSLSPFRMNEVELDPKGTSTDVELSSTSQRVAPYAGAVVLLKYGTVTGRSVLINARSSSNTVIPFGAEVLDEKGSSLGIVGQGGVIFLRANEDSGRLTVRWGRERNAQCVLQYALGPRDPKAESTFDQITATCETPADLARKKGGTPVVGNAGDASGARSGS
ncbi:fimbrial biogenesis outer membrane usher protein [Herbaspirillum sp. LeCh32-8]|nr:fimbrial biogenesis outer membrane usher protein [Herbaspirillum sp. LeCh32-8]